MAVRGSTLHKNHNPYKLSPLNQFFYYIGCLLGHTLESRKGIEMKLCV